MRQLFGTDGVRGVANTYPMTVEMAVKLGRAAAYIFKNGSKRHKIVIGKDTRLSCYMLENAMAAGICSMGVDVLLVGPLPTPGIAFITSSMRADAGVVISASHNLYQDNGIKFFSKEGFKLPDELEEKIEELIFNDSIDGMRPTASEVGKAYRIDDAVGRYVVFLKNTFPKELSLYGLKIAVDCANGAAYKVAPEVFYELGADVVPVAVKPDGENINYKCGSLHPENVKDVVLKEKADVGITLDGDGDRVILVDENGEMLDGDYLMAIAADTMIREKRLKKNTLVATVMSNMGLFAAVKKSGGRIIQTAVGDRYVVEEMLKGGYNLGGEQSGHIVFIDNNTTGDGILSALQILAVMKKTGKSLSGLKKIMIKYPQVLVNVKVRKKNFENYKEVTTVIKDIEGKLKDKGRVVVRASGTESLIRVMLEGEDKRKIQGYADEIAGVIKKKLT